MQALANAIVWLVALILVLGLAAAVVVPALDSYFGFGWFSRLPLKGGGAPLNDPDPLNALAARQHIEHGQRVVDHSSWQDSTSDHGSGGESGGGGD